MTTGEKIKEARISKGMTQEELGKLVGVQRAAINKYESGLIVNFKRSTISKLCNALNVDPAWLIDESEKPTDGESAGLTDQEKQLIHYFRMLPADRRKNVLSLLCDLSAAGK